MILNLTLCLAGALSPVAPGAVTWEWDTDSDMLAGKQRDLVLPEA